LYQSFTLPLKYSKHFQIVFASILSTNWEALGHEKRLLSTKKSRFNSVIPIYQDRKKVPIHLKISPAAIMLLL
jgi:hypothetical protein